MKTTIERIFEQLSETTKVELASEKIELSITDDAKKVIDNAKQEASKGDEFLKKHKANIKNYEKLKKDLKAGSNIIQKNIEQAGKYTKKLDKVYDKLDDVQTKIRKTADELGVPLKSIPVAEDIFQSKRTLGDSINELDTMLDYNEHLDL
jgi:uncharacterized coiled-coil DUF342 family protein